MNIEDFFNVEAFPDVEVKLTQGDAEIWFKFKHPESTHYKNAQAAFYSQIATPDEKNKTFNLNDDVSVCVGEVEIDSPKTRRLDAERLAACMTGWCFDNSFSTSMAANLLEMNDGLRVDIKSALDKHLEAKKKSSSTEQGEISS